MKTKTLNESDLRQFYGTENYYRHFSGLVYTDGVKYVADAGGAHWLLDAIGSYQHDKRIAKNRMLKEMQFWKLKAKDGTAVLTCVEDSGRKPVITQKIEYADFPLNEIDIWVENGCMMLPSER